jgi:uncharacterized membrane protein YcaP (DUF421 family)
VHRQEERLNLDQMFFQIWAEILRAIVGVLAYIVLILFLRISGKRTLAKLNAFELVVTVALGSTLHRYFSINLLLLPKALPPSPC